MSAMRSSSSGELHELGLLAAARAIRNGEVSSEVYVDKLLERASGHADFNAFITIDETSVREAARQADRSLRAGRSAPLLGGRLAVKDSYLTNELTTTFGTSVLANFKPKRDAVAVAREKDAGAMDDGCRPVRHHRGGERTVPHDNAGRAAHDEAGDAHVVGALHVGYAAAGPADGPAVILLHGWPYDIYSSVDVAPLLASAGYRVIVPYLRGYGTTRFRSHATPRNGQQSVLAVDIIAVMDALHIERAIFAGYDWGARTANIIAALWPERCKALVSVSGYLIGSQEINKMPLPPKAELAWWYQCYFATARGQAGYEQYRREFAKLIWQLASPQWDFDAATFEHSAAAFDTPDHVSIVIHNYRWRLGLAAGEPQYDALEQRLAQGPVIAVPPITLEGDANGVSHPDASAYAKQFSGLYAHQVITGGVGHNLPQERPQAFAKAVGDVDGY